MPKAKREASDDEGFATGPSAPARSAAAKWSPEQDMKLFHALYARKSTSNWKEVGSLVGRDIK